MNQGALPPEILRPQTVTIELRLESIDAINTALENSHVLSAAHAKSLVNEISEQTMQQIMAHHEANQPDKRNGAVDGAV